MVDWRRNKVQQLLVQGHSQWDIADELQIDQSTVSRDIQCLRQQAQENLKTHIQNKLSEEYERCLTGMNRVLKLSWQIANNNNGKQNGQDLNDNSSIITTGDDRTRLQALSLINDCYKYIMELTTNGVVITDAIKFVQTNKEKLTSMSRKEDDKESEEPDYNEDKDQSEEEQEKKTGETETEQETTNRVF
jgi:transposase